MRNIIGRRHERELLLEKYHTEKSELAVVYGRRRVGKSVLLLNFVHRTEGKGKKQSLSFEGLEKQRTPAQIKHFVHQLKQQIDNPLLQKAEFSRWNEVFDFLSSYCAEQKEKTILVFDEFQWMAANQTKLVSLIKFYWDNHWKNSNVMLILCGSIASFMVKKVLRSKALYGRFTLELHVKKLPLNECKEFFNSSYSLDTILRFILIFGGVPKYLEEINQKKSFQQNLEALLFRENALFLEEFEKIFNVHFKESENYLKIIRALQQSPLTLGEIANTLDMASSGGVKTYLENLELAEFIRPNYFFQPERKKNMTYVLSDEFLSFYTHFVLPNKNVIKRGGGKNLLKNKVLAQLVPWMGFRLEKYINDNALYFAERIGIADYVQSYGSYYSKKSSVQVDLVYKRTDKTLSVCEIKFYDGLVGTDIIPEFEKKLEKLPRKSTESVHKVLFAPNGASKPLLASKYFDEIVVGEDCF